MNRKSAVWPTNRIKIAQVTPNIAQALQGLPFWISAFLTGLAAVGFTLAFKWAGSLSVAILKQHPYSIFLLSPACFLFAWWIVYRHAPEAAGSGIPQVLAANALDHSYDTKKIKNLLGLKTAVIKIISALVCLVGGGAIGREGPTIQIGASIFHAIGARFQRFWPQTSHHSWIVAGGAAGIAAAFNTPLGGLVFAIEELSTSHFNQFRTVLISGVILSGLVSQWILGSYLYLGYPKVGDFSFSLIPSILLVGVVTGIGGAVFGRTLLFLVQKRNQLKKSWQLAILAIMTGLGMATLAFTLGPDSMGSGTELITDLLFKPNQVVSWEWAIIRFAGSVISYISGCAGGIFAPSLAIGAAMGSQISLWMHQQDVSNLMVLLGMIGFLTGVTRAPFTSFVLVLEMTDGHAAIFPMMLSALISFAISKLIDENSFYEHMKEHYLNK